jgi:hypothetical protein
MIEIACGILRRNVRVARHILTVAADNLASADEAATMALRLAHDMFPLAEQIRLTAYFATAGAARALGAVPAGLPVAPTGWLSADAILAAALHDVTVVADATIVPPDEKIAFAVQGKPVCCSVSHLLFAHLIPNQYFHLSMTYALLRHSGVPLSKIDYLSRDMLDDYATA